MEPGDGGGGDSGGGVEGLARLGTGRWAPGGGAGRATQGPGPSHARYRDNMLARGSTGDCGRGERAPAFIPDVILRYV